MITSYALKEGGKLEYPEGFFKLITIIDKGNEFYCVMQAENSNCIKEKTFQRVGEEIKSGTDIGDYIRYVPPKKILKIGQEITLPMGLKAEISDILGKTDDGGWSCLVQIGNAVSHSWEIVYP
jgi:hypothetical protein